KAPYPDETTLKLSEAFHNPAEIGRVPGDISLELRVKVYNINRGHNEGIIRRCAALAGYSAFIARVREYEGQGSSREEVMKEAVQACIKEDILKGFLETHSREVMNMLLTEWNWDDALAVREEEGREEGWEKGREAGREEAIKNLLQFGMSPEQISRALRLPMDTISRYLSH
ncbi:MAG: hypothetical protein LBU28_03325, partial [Spirochaetaceae bacterium]|nr:hypothetical protein [Spirochaetaceae bacterium]